MGECRERAGVMINFIFCVVSYILKPFITRSISWNACCPMLSRVQGTDFIAFNILFLGDCAAGKHKPWPLDVITHWVPAWVGTEFKGIGQFLTMASWIACTILLAWLNWQYHSTTSVYIGDGRGGGEEPQSGRLRCFFKTEHDQMLITSLVSCPGAMPFAH